ncbi:MAG: LemA family protein [Treponema sp.]|nr:LemA family protein [Treponema sp.]
MAESKKKFPTWAIVLIVIAVLALLCVKKYTGTYNNMVTLDEGVSSSWSQVQNQYQRRYDLIPNLVNTVKGYASHETDVLTQVTEARSKAGGVINVSDEVLQDPEAFARFQQVQDSLGASLQRLLAVTEAYPDLKANENFLSLQTQLEGTENRIAQERRKFNDSVKSYNNYIRKFPNNIIANMSGFDKKAYFAAGSEAQNAPAVQF